MITLMVHIPRDEIISTIGPYAVVVEMWDKLKQGRHHRKYLAVFNAQERDACRKLYAKFYGWYLRYGEPEEWICRTSTINLARKLIQFCGEL